MDERSSPDPVIRYSESKWLCRIALALEGSLCDQAMILEDQAILGAHMGA